MRIRLRPDDLVDGLTNNRALRHMGAPQGARLVVDVRVDLAPGQVVAQQGVGGVADRAAVKHGRPRQRLARALARPQRHVVPGEARHQQRDQLARAPLCPPPLQQVCSDVHPRHPIHYDTLQQLRVAYRAAFLSANGLVQGRSQCEAALAPGVHVPCRAASGCAA